MYFFKTNLQPHVTVFEKKKLAENKMQILFKKAPNFSFTIYFQIISFNKMQRVKRGRKQLELKEQWFKKY